MLLLLARGPVMPGGGLYFGAGRCPLDLGLIKNHSADAVIPHGWEEDVGVGANPRHVMATRS